MKSPLSFILLFVTALSWAQNAPIKATTPDGVAVLLTDGKLVKLDGSEVKDLPLRIKDEQGRELHLYSNWPQLYYYKDRMLSVSEGDVNAKLALKDTQLRTLCSLAQTNTTQTFDKVQNFTSFEEGLFSVANMDEIVFTADENAAPIPDSYKREITLLWDSKYSKIYCPLGSGFAPEGYLDFHLLLTEQYQAFNNLYDPTKVYKADINRVVKLDPYVSDEKAQWMTLADLLRHYINKPVGQMTESHELRDNFNFYYDLITKHWGAKHYSELTEEERKAHR